MLSPRAERKATSNSRLPLCSLLASGRRFWLLGKSSLLWMNILEDMVIVIDPDTRCSNPRSHSIHLVRVASLQNPRRNCERQLHGLFAPLVETICSAFGITFAPVLEELTPRSGSSTRIVRTVSNLPQLILPISAQKWRRLYAYHNADFTISSVNP